eukprot:scaffold12765_cov54-Phaeocystis_antarctica.AAC.1
MCRGHSEHQPYQQRSAPRRAHLARRAPRRAHLRMILGPNVPRADGKFMTRWLRVCFVSVGLACRHSAHMQRWSGGASPRRGAQQTRPNVRRPKLASPAAFAHAGSCQGTGLPWETPKNAGCCRGWG